MHLGSGSRAKRWRIGRTRAELHWTASPYENRLREHSMRSPFRLSKGWQVASHASGALKALTISMSWRSGPRQLEETTSLPAGQRKAAPQLTCEGSHVRSVVPSSAFAHVNGSSHHLMQHDRSRPSPSCPNKIRIHTARVIKLRQLDVSKTRKQFSKILSSHTRITCFVQRFSRQSLRFLTDVQVHLIFLQRLSVGTM